MNGISDSLITEIPQCSDGIKVRKHVSQDIVAMGQKKALVAVYLSTPTLPNTMVNTDMPGRSTGQGKKGELNEIKSGQEIAA